MATKVNFFDENLVIYRERSNVLGLGLLISVFCIGFGSLFLKSMPDEIFPRVFGMVFITIGILVLIGLPKYYGKMKNKSGAIIFEADVKGISEGSPFNTLENNYSWNSIEKIILASKHVEKGLDSDGASHSWNLMFIFLNKKTNNNIGFIQRSKKQISISPKGHDFITIQLPKNSLIDIREKLASLSNNQIEIFVCKHFEFHYGKDIEAITP